MTRFDKPAVLLLVSSHCPHCHTLEKLLQQRVTDGFLGKPDVVNIEQSTELAKKHGVRSVPWLKLGQFIFDEMLTPAELDRWIVHAREGSGQPQYIERLLERGKLANAIEWIEEAAVALKALMPLLSGPDSKLNVRVGVGAILEHFEDTPAIRDLIPDLVTLLQDGNPVTRVDACHYLSLTHSSEAIVPLTEMLDDEDRQVREIARESIEALNTSLIDGKPLGKDSD